MFDNIGGKIKGLAKFLCWLGIIISLIMAILIWTGGAKVSSAFNSSYYGYSSRSAANAASGTAVITGLVVLVVGSLASWLGSFFMYGFGQLIEDTQAIRAATDVMSRKDNSNLFTGTGAGMNGGASYGNQGYDPGAGGASYGGQGYNPGAGSAPYGGSSGTGTNSVPYNNGTGF